MGKGREQRHRRHDHGHRPLVTVTREANNPAADRLGKTRVVQGALSTKMAAATMVASLLKLASASDGVSTLVIASACHAFGSPVTSRHCLNMSRTRLTGSATPLQHLREAQGYQASSD